MKKLLFFAIGFIIISCSNKDLDRDLAESKIIEHFSIPCVEVASFQNETLGRNNVPQKHADFIRQGYIYCNSEGSWNNRYYLTEKSMPYFSQENNIIAGNLIEFNEITGIKFNDAKNQAIVDFSFKRKGITPFGEFAERFEDEAINLQIEFELYDDGWRIKETNLDQRFVPKEVFSLYNK
ncbi:MAG: hypothetical protein J0L86_02565 [Flavobacteriales bacterium]|nr:hypothetical protein [Flavobacteriales bacterium]